MAQGYRYSVTYGLRGCYMPDSATGPYTGTTRRELANLVRDMLDMYGMPRCRFNDANIKAKWPYIARHGSSQAHFYLYDGGNVLSFHGLTHDEAEQMEKENE